MWIYCQVEQYYCQLFIPVQLCARIRLQEEAKFTARSCLTASQFSSSGR
jgi:hypothetical protein